jgi:hypothetical protein
VHEQSQPAVLWLLLGQPAGLVNSRFENLKNYVPAVALTLPLPHADTLQAQHTQHAPAARDCAKKRGGRAHRSALHMSWPEQK